MTTTRKIYLFLLVFVLALATYFLVLDKSDLYNGAENNYQENSMMENESELAVTPVAELSRGAYAAYSDIVFQSAEGKKRVLFFHASWCPTCRSANAEFEKSLDQIPADVVLFKTDYDAEDTLKNRYGITYQHTFVQVDENGKELAKWNGGGIDELLDNVQ